MRGELPQYRRLLDESFDPATYGPKPSRRHAAPGDGRRIIEQLQVDVGPFLFVRLVADREIETLQAELDRVSHEFT